MTDSQDTEQPTIEAKEEPKPEGQILPYQTADGQQRIEVRLEGGSVWLSQILLAELFQTTVPNINLHIKNIYEEGELLQEATIKEYLIVRQEGSSFHFWCCIRFE